jgi:carbon monoxide dehydrogenase subunit G
MQLTGTHVIKAPPEKVWAMLMDTDILAKMVPGITSLEKLEENKFKAMLGVKLGPVNASFAGQLQLENLLPPQSFSMKVQQNSKVGNAAANIGIKLVAVDELQTEVNFDGDVKLSGMLATMGQRLIGSVANTLSKQFFQNMEKELEKA